MTASVRVVVPNPSGLHARPAALFVRTAGAFRAEVTVRNLARDTAAVNAKSIISVMTLGVAQGAEIEIAADGDDAAAAVEAIAAAVRDGLGEAPAADGGGSA